MVPVGPGICAPSGTYLFSCPVLSVIAMANWGQAIDLSGNNVL